MHYQDTLYHLGIGVADRQSVIDAYRQALEVELGEQGFSQRP